MPTSNHRQCGQPTGGCFQVCHSLYRLEATHLEKLALDKKPEGAADSLQTPAWLGKGSTLELGEWLGTRKFQNRPIELCITDAKVEEPRYSCPMSMF